MRFLYIDDRPIDGLEKLLSDDGHSLETYETVEDGIKGLEQNWDNIDAIILDALGSLHGVVNNPQSLNRALMDIKDLENKKRRRIPFCVLTGNAAHVKSTLVDPTEVAVFSKPFEIQEMIEFLIKEVNSAPEHQIKDRYKNELETLVSIGVAENSRRVIFQVLLELHGVRPPESTDKAFNTIRDLLEHLFEDAIRVNLIQPECKNERGKPIPALCSKYLAGWSVKETRWRQVQFTCLKKGGHLPKLLHPILEALVKLVNPMSHKADTDVIELRARVKSPHLLYASTLMLLDVYTWYASYVADNPDPEENKQYWGQVSPLP